MKLNYFVHMRKKTHSGDENIQLYIPSKNVYQSKNPCGFKSPVDWFIIPSILFFSFYLIGN